MYWISRHLPLPVKRNVRIYASHAKRVLLYAGIAVSVRRIVEAPAQAEEIIGPNIQTVKMGKTTVYIIIGLMVVILVIFITREMSKQKAAQADAAVRQAELMALNQALALQAQRDQIEAESTVGLNDWLDFGGNLLGAAGGIFSGMFSGGANTTTGDA